MQYIIKPYIRADTIPITMKKYLLLALFPLFGLAASAQDNGENTPTGDKELFGYIHSIMRMPNGTHKIYNGKGTSVFDVQYTIEADDNKWVVYKGGTKSYFDILYTVERSSDGCKIYKGSSNSVFNILYTIKRTDKGFKVYKGNSFFDLIYSYERD